MLHAVLREIKRQQRPYTAQLRHSQTQPATRQAGRGRREWQQRQHQQAGISRRAVWCRVVSCLTSCSLQGTLLMCGLRWLCQRSRHCFPVLPGSWAAMQLHFFAPICPTSSATRASSSGDHGPFVPPLNTLVHRWKHCMSVFPGMLSATCSRGKGRGRDGEDLRKAFVYQISGIVVRRCDTGYSSKFNPQVEEGGWAWGEGAEIQRTKSTSFKGKELLCSIIVVTEKRFISKYGCIYMKYMKQRR